MSPIRVKSGKARTKWRDLLDQVLAGKGDVIIERDGKDITVMIPAENYGQIREMLENTCAVRETKAAYETLKARPVQIDTAARTATLPLEVYEQLIAERYARFAVIREMQENAPDLSEEEINAVVSETIQESGRKMLRAVLDTNLIVSSIISKKDVPSTESCLA